MAFFSAYKSQDSITQIPRPFSFSPQFWLAHRKQPITVPPPSSRNSLMSKLPTLPPALKPDIVPNRYYQKVSSKLCSDYIVPSGTTYFSREQLLRKMYKRRVQYRTYGTTESVFNSNTMDLFMKGVEICGPPFDCWMTFPIQQSQQQQEEEDPGNNEESASGWIIGPVKCTREMLDRQVGMRVSSDGLKYPWVTNASSTKFHSLEKLMDINGIRMLDGFVECIECGELLVVAYLLPARFGTVMMHMITGTALIDCDFICQCNRDEDGNGFPLLPIICPDFNKIDWLFLFFGMGIGFCTEEQLMYYCNERKLRYPNPTGITKTTLLHMVYVDIITQLDPESKFRHRLTQRL